MDKPIKNVMDCTDKYFNVVCEKLKENGYSTKLFKMQIAVYRNYSSGPEGILEVSPWAAPWDPNLPSDLQGPVLLKSFLETIRAKDGQGYEAMEIGLAHALKEIQKPEDGIPLSLIIVMGDAPANISIEYIDVKKKYISSK